MSSGLSGPSSIAACALAAEPPRVKAGLRVLEPGGRGRDLGPSTAAEPPLSFFSASLMAGCAEFYLYGRVEGGAPAELAW